MQVYNEHEAKWVDLGAEECVYGIDKEGYLLDANNVYIFDQKGYLIKLSKEHI